MPLANVFGGGECPPCPPCPPGSASWKAVKELDFTGLDSQSMTGAVLKTFNLAKGGVFLIDAVTSTNATTYDYSSSAAGLTYNTMTGTGISQIAFDLTTTFSKTGGSSLTFDDWEDPVCVMFQIAGVTWGSVVHDLQVGFGEVTDRTMVTNLSFGWRANYDGVDNNYLTRRYQGSASETNVITNEPTTATITLAIIIHAGLITEMWATPGGTFLPPDPRTMTYGPFSAGFSGIASGTMPLALNVGFCPYFGVAKGGAGTDPAFTLTKFGVYRWE